MKSRLFSLLIFFPFFLLCCTPQQPNYRIGVSQCLDDAWRQKMNQEMSRELLLHPEMTISTRIAYGSNVLQCAQIDSFISERVDLLIVSPNEAEEVKPAVTRAYRAGIPVIVADRRVTGDEWTAFIGGDNYKVGGLMAEWILKKKSECEVTPNRPFHVLEICGLQGSTPATLRHKGMMDGLQVLEKADSGSPVVVHSVMGEWQKTDAYNAVQQYLSENPLPDVVVAQNDLMAIGAAEAIHDFLPYGSSSARPIMGVDGIKPGLQAIVDGVIECTAIYSSRGDMIIQAASQILSGEPFIRDTVLETMLIDAMAARPMLKQVDAREHDLETLRLVQAQNEQKWQQLNATKKMLVYFVIVSCVLFLLSIGYVLFAQGKMQTEIRRDIIPQLEEVQEAIQLSRKDAVFAERLRQVVDEHLSDPNLNVESLGSMLQLSRTQLFRRVKMVAGKGPLDYIRERRLVQADKLLHTTDMTVQQVALSLCFSSPGYFTKCYTEYFGHLPSVR